MNFLTIRKIYAVYESQIEHSDFTDSDSVHQQFTDKEIWTEWDWNRQVSSKSRKSLKASMMLLNHEHEHLSV